ncbi:MAG: hypothetical protein M1816_004308 [Peltula sp. TS41687]|nr:MAG: hypothetical protein M1816_004308 [Peltula sp. TS41687]
MKSARHLTVVIKLGSSSIVDEERHEPQLSTLSLIVEAAVRLHNEGHKVVIVSSGAIAVGLRRMDVAKRPKLLNQVQALAAVGQCRLMSLWDNLFGHFRQPVAQILLTRNDIADRTRYRNAKNTLTELFNMGVIPIVNENDTLAVAEIKFGDNDTLSAITAAMVQADYLFLMTDVDCLYDKNPRTYSDARAIEVVEDLTALSADVTTPGSSLGTGGMMTKVVAARLATSAGVTTIITRSSQPGNINKILTYLQANGSKGLSYSPPLHTRFLPNPHPIRDRSFWLLHGLRPNGTIYIDEGAYQALLNKAGLLPVGIIAVEGSFAQQESVHLVVSSVKEINNPYFSSAAAAATFSAETTTAGNVVVGKKGPSVRGQEVGRALVNYSATEIMRIKGLKSTEIVSVLGYADSEYVAHRDNISFFPLGAGAGAGATTAGATTAGATTAGATTAGGGGGGGVAANLAASSTTSTISTPPFMTPPTISTPSLTTTSTTDVGSSLITSTSEKYAFIDDGGSKTLGR